MFLGIDCGTQGTKALIVDDAGRTLGRGHAAHDLIERANGAREQEPSWWVAAMAAAVRGAIADAGVSGRDIVALGVSGQQHGLVVLDETGASIRPAKLWNDTETAPQNEALIAGLGGAAAWFDQLGIVPRTGYTISKLLWLKENEPDNFRRVRRILLPHDYLNYWLTGRAVAEYGDASGTGFFDIRRRVWATAPLDLIDGGSGFLAAALPELIAPDAVVGSLTAVAAEALGLSTRCLVSAGGGDNMMGAIGTGNVRAGVVTISLGTSATAYCYADEPVTDADGWVAPFCSSSGGWLPLICTMNATNVTGRMVSAFGHDIGFLSEALAATLPGAGGLTLLPFLNGERTPDLPTATGSLVGLRSDNLTQENLVRAMVEGVSFGVTGAMRRILGGRDPERIFLVGGGARSAPWRQLIADASGAEIVVPAGEEAGCLGGALQAMWAARREAGTPEPLSAIAERSIALDADKTMRPDPARRAAYDDAFGRYADALRRIYGVRA
ncbi:Xylulose kinase [uncultured Pleomorphomonas sp.]|uniref:Xylulose kinase n=1 Tax=uncultured Pleomorphomonas sp. TaxID=442121 RepID=A0A212LIB7_9HYPH|nr:xylulokinase [uncultured Pleomorphomonas sp.]SCM77292.1 Xylulose kinase [uncultured Pleomorphomonas sp.]